MPTYLTAVLLMSIKDVSSNNCQIQGRGNIVRTGNGCENNYTVEGYGSLIEEERNVGKFNAVSASGYMHITLEADSKHNVWIRAEDNVISNIVTTNTQGILNISLKSRNNNLQKDIHVHITAPNFENLKTNGQIRVDDIGFYKGNDIQLNVNGQSSVVLDEFEFSESPKINVVGQSDLTVHINDVVRSLKVNGQSDAILYGVDYIEELDISGQSKVQLPKDVGIGSQEDSGQSDIIFL